jgi:hypothetical protein
MTPGNWCPTEDADPPRSRISSVVVKDSSIRVEVTVRDGRYTLRGAPGQDDPLPDSADGWLTVGEENWMSVICGTRWRPVEVTFTPLLGSPEPSHKDFLAEAVGERDLYCESKSFLVVENYVDSTLTISAAGSSWIRVRVSARSRQEAFVASDVTGAPVEHHLIEYWPIVHQEGPRIVTGPDAFGRNYLV